MTQKSKYTWVKGNRKLRYQPHPVSIQEEGKPLGAFVLYEHTGCSWQEIDRISYSEANGTFEAIPNLFEKQGNINTDQEPPALS